jgi:hypothetical protein
MITKDTLERYVKEGWLIKQSHPTLPLSIYNYSQATQYAAKWDEVTLACRGLITDDETGMVIIKPFSKFFNYEEMPNEVPWTSSEYVYVQEKMDGSLGILFNYSGEWIMATRGSFTSDQAIRGMEILKSKYILDAFEPSVAYICEIIYPENRIVVNYNKEKIAFLGAVINWTFNGWKESDWSELHWTTAQAYFKMSGIKKSDIVETKQIFKEDLGHELYKELKDLNAENREGYVLRFHPSNTRVKIKFTDYVKLHHILTNCSSYDIWENLRTFGKLPEEFLTDVPDEFYEWVKKIEAMLNKQYDFVLRQHMAYMSSILRDGMLTQKEFALRVLDLKDVNHGLIFAMYNAKDDKIQEIIWKIIKPEYEKPFTI